jgi:hypothetical protein
VRSGSLVLPLKAVLANLISVPAVSLFRSPFFIGE